MHENIGNTAIRGTHGHLMALMAMPETRKSHKILLQHEINRIKIDMRWIKGLGSGPGTSGRAIMGNWRENNIYRSDSLHYVSDLNETIFIGLANWGTDRPLCPWAPTHVSEYSHGPAAPQWYKSRPKSNNKDKPPPPSCDPLTEQRTSF